MPSKYLDEDRQERWARRDYRFADDLAGRQVLVAGGSGGLGSAICARLLDAGADVMLSYRSGAARAEAVRAALDQRDGGSLSIAAADITVDDARRDLLEALDPERFYGAVICVGHPSRIAADDLGVDSLEQALRDNYSGPILLARGCAELLAAHQTPGALVLLSSMQGVAAFPGSLPYSGPKAALVHGAKILAQEFGGAMNVRVNVVAPGVTESGMALASISSGKYDRYVDEGIIPRFGWPEDIARCVAFFMAPDNYVTGQTLVVDGGLTLRRGTP